MRRKDHNTTGKPSKHLPVGNSSKSQVRLTAEQSTAAPKDSTEVGMDPLTAAVLAAITSYVSTQTQDFLNQAGEVAFAKAKAIFSKLKERWKGDEAASRDLESFEKEPKIYAPAVQGRLESKLSEDNELRQELEQLVNEMGPQISILQDIARGEGLLGIQAEEMTRGRVTVEQRMTEAKDVTGAKFGKIG
jgi:hypothetical protein